MENQIKEQGIFSEQDGAKSMRRVLAFMLAIAAVILFGAGAVLKSIEAVYGGIACLAGAVILLFFTTWADVAAVVSAWKKGA